MTDDIKKFLEAVNKFDFAGEKAGQKPGDQWRGKDADPPGKKLVGGSAEESIVRELNKHVKETSVERKLKKDFDDFDSEDWANWDDKIKRLKQRAKQGELVTVWDKEKRVYKNVPKSEIKEYQNRQDQDAQVTSPPSPDASATALAQVQDKIFARDVEGETVEEQTPATANAAPTTTTTTPPAPAAAPAPTTQAFGGNQGRQTYAQAQPAAPAATAGYKFTPDQEKWLGGANRQDPDILKRMPGPKPGVDYFKGTDDQARAKTLNIGRSNLNTIKGAVGAQKAAPEVFPTKPAPAPAVTAPKPQAAAPAPTRPVVVDQPQKTSADPNAYKKVPQQTIKVDAPATATPASAVQQPAKPARTTWQSLAKLNPQIKNPDRIYPGQEITLPNGTKAIVDKGDTLSGIAQRYRQGGYNAGTPVAPATATATPVKPQPDIKGKELPKVSGKAAAQLQKGREYRARQSAEKEPSFAGRSKTAGGAVVDPNARISTKQAPTRGLRAPADLANFDDGASFEVPKSVSQAAAQAAKDAQAQAAAKAQPQASQADVRRADNKIAAQTPAATTTPAATVTPAQAAPTKTQEPGIQAFGGKQGRETYAQSKLEPQNIASYEAPVDIGSISSEFESGNRGSSAVGFDKTGGTSYGKYQIATRTGTMDEFMDFLKTNNPEAHAALAAAGPADAGKDGKFAATWKSLADSGKLGNSEQQFIKASHYDVGVDGLKNKNLTGMVDNSKALKEVMWSTSVQHGGDRAAKIFNKVYKPGMSEQDVIKAVYDERAKRFGSSSDAVQKSVRNRFNQEQQQALALVGGTPTSESLMARYRKFVKEYGNQQNPDTQATSGDTPESDAEAELKRQRMDRRVSQGTLGGLSAVLPPGTNTAAAASGLTKMVDQKPLSGQEQAAISGIMPLVARAAEEPSTSASLKSALGKAGMLTKLGVK